MTAPTSLEPQSSEREPARGPGPGPGPEPCATPAGTGLPDIDDAAERFRRDGVAHLRGIFADWVDVLRAGVERNMASPGPYTKEYEPEGSQGYFFGDYCNWARIPEYREFVLHSNAAETGRPAHGFGHRALLPRARAGEGAENRVPHALAPRPALLLHRRDADRELLDSARSGAALGMPGAGGGVPPLGEVVPAEEVHRRRLRARGRGRSTPCRTSTRAARSSRSRRSTWRPATPSRSTSSPCTARPGTRRRSARRRAFAHRWVGDDVRFRIRGGEVSPPFPDVHRRLRDGDPLDDPEFPLVWAEKG